MTQKANVAVAYTTMIHDDTGTVFERAVARLFRSAGVPETVTAQLRELEPGHAEVELPMTFMVIRRDAPKGEVRVELFRDFTDDYPSGVVSRLIAKKLREEIEREARAAAVTAELAEAVRAVQGTLDYMIGPNARSATSHESRKRYNRVRHALARAEGKPCPFCTDFGVDEHSLYGPWPCRMDGTPGHEHVTVPSEAYEYAEHIQTPKVAEEEPA